jgi:hypothetical protein
MATYYNTGTQIITMRGDIEQILNGLNPSDAKMRIWLAGNGVASYSVSDAEVIDSGGHHSTVTVNGQPDFYVPPSGRWSDEFDVSSLTDGTVSFFATVAGILPRLTPVGGGSEVTGVVTMDNIDLDFLVNDDCSGDFTGWIMDSGKLGQAYNDKISLRLLSGNLLLDKPIFANVSKRPSTSQFIIEIEMQVTEFTRDGGEGGWDGGYCSLSCPGVSGKSPTWCLKFGFRSVLSVAHGGSLGVYVDSVAGIDMSKRGLYRFLIDLSGGEENQICQAFVDYGEGFVSLGYFNISGAESNIPKTDVGIGNGINFSSYDWVPM